MSSQVFNEQENPAVAHTVFESTAGEALTGVPNAKVAEEVEKNVDQAHTAAEHAATVAKVKGLELTGERISAAEQFKAGASNVATDAAVEGQKDMERAKAASASYLEQAKTLATSAICTAQSYLPASLGGAQTTNPDLSPHTKPGSSESATESVASSLQSGVTSTIATAKQYVDTVQSQVERAKGTAQGLTGAAGAEGAMKDNPDGESATGSVVSSVQSGVSSAVDTAKHHAGAAQETVQSQLERAKGAAQGILGTTGTQGAQLAEEGPATSAPLESGSHTIENTTYPPSTSIPATKIADNEPRAP